MLLSLDSKLFNDIRSRVTSDFESPLPPADTLARAWSDPQVRKYFTPENAPLLGELLQETGLRAFQFVQAKVGVNVGIPGEIIQDFAKSITSQALEQGRVNWVALAEGVADSTVDIAIDAMGCIPIVGWIAEVAFGLVKTIMALVRDDKPKPLLLTYSKEHDQSIAQRAIDMLGNLYNPTLSDWTPLFLPATSGDWHAIEASNGFVVRPKNDADGFGCVPPSAFGYNTLQVRGNPYEAASAAKASGAGKVKWKSFGDLTPYIEDTYAQTPSLARVANAAWAAMSTNESATVFNVRVSPIAAQWNNYIDRGIHWAKAQKGKWGAPLGSALYLHLTKPTLPVNVPHVRKAITGTPVDALVQKWAEFIYQRQVQMCRTAACAYVSERQAAFVDNLGLRTELVEGRKLLLRSKERNSIRIDDVLDLDFRQELQNGPQRASFVAGSSPSMPGRPQRTPPMRSPSGGGGGMAVGVAAAIALGGVFYLLRGRQ